MKVTEVTLTNFRNYTKSSVNTDADLVLILGDNAAGKTNLLESVHYLSRLKSFRAPDEFLVRHGESFFEISGRGPDWNAQAIVQTIPVTKRAFRLNEQKIPRNRWQLFRTVLFVPGDLNLFISGPAARRKFLDEVLVQTSAEYAAALQSLDHVLKQKSALLDQLREGLGDLGQLDFWNEQLALFSSVLAGHRREFTDYLSERLPEALKSLTDFSAQFRFDYKRQGLSADDFLRVLAAHREAEIRSGQNLVGPQRDDFKIYKDEVENVYNSSRGELRAQVLALKLLEAEFLGTTGPRPVILLDDVFSELDETRRARLLTRLVGHQIFITTTEEHHLPVLSENLKVIRVENNQIK